MMMQAMIAIRRAMLPVRALTIVFRIFSAPPRLCAAAGSTKSTEKNSAMIAIGRKRCALIDIQDLLVHFEKIKSDCDESRPYTSQEPAVLAGSWGGVCVSS